MSEFDTPYPVVKKNKKKILATKILLKSLIYSFAIFGILFILLLLVVISMLRQESGVVTIMPKKAILTIDFDENYTEMRNDDLWAEVTNEQSMTFFDLIKAINIAAADERVKVIVANVGNTNLGLAQIQDLRQAIKLFRSTGKKAYLHSNGFGSFGQGTKEYYLAAAFDEIWMQPNTEVGITGVAIEVPFFRNVLDKIGVTPEFYSRYEYKTAMASIMDKKMSAPYKEEITRLGASIFNQFVGEIAQDRKITTGDLKKLINNAPIMSEKALENKLIDKIAYKQDLFEQVKNDTKARVIDAKGYNSNIKTFTKGVPTIAYMVIEGVIAEGESYNNPLRDEVISGSKTVVEQIQQIQKDGGVKGLILRINSPGGGYAASNEIWYAIKQLKEKKKIPVVVSMGDYAASGGYFIALAGDTIVAEPSTITGSIGVLGGKIVLEKLWKKLGVDWSGVNFGKNSGILSANRNFSKSEKEIFNKSLDAVYKDFTLKVSESRKIDLEQVDKLARGRVWTGEGAYKNKLVDLMGGVETAIAKLQQDIGMKPGERYKIDVYPREKTLQEKIQQLMNSGKGVYARQILNELNIDIEGINLLQRLQYDAVLPPFKIEL